MKTKFVLIAVLFHLLAAWFSTGRYHADEQFQVIEFIGYKTGVNTASEMPWEFHEQMRPATQVWFGYVFLKIIPFVSSPFIQVFFLRLFSSLLGLFALYKLLTAFKFQLSEKQFQLLVALSSLYCFIPYFHARFSSENISSSLFILGLAAVFSPRKRFSFFLAGIFFGLAYAVRLQSLFLLAGLGLWLLFIYKSTIKDLFLLVAGCCISFVFGLLCDRWFYGEWVNTSWNYIYQNIVLHRSAEYGTDPWWFYFEHVFFDLIPPFSIIIVFSFFILFVYLPRHVLSWMFIPFLLIHFITPHKELRFFFPLINFIPLVVVLAFKEMEENSRLEWLRKFLHQVKGFFIRPLFLVVNTLLLLYLCCKPADENIPVLKFLYDNYGGQETGMYYASYNPYNELISLNFYKSKTIMRVETDFKSVSFGNNKKKTLVVTEGFSQQAVLLSRGYRLKTVYSSVPDLLFYFNVNNWIGRVGVIRIHEVE